MRQAVSPFATALAAVLAATPTAAGQWIPSFDVDVAASNFAWSGSTSLGPLVGNPSNAFQMEGSASVALAAQGSQALASGAFAGSDVFPIPDLAGQVPNPFPFLPPLATFSVTGLHVSLTSDPFAIAADGSWTAPVTVTALSGTLLVDPLVGTPSSQDLTGLASDPELASGTLEHLAGNVRLISAIDSTFPFADPGSGVSGTITLAGTLLARWFCPPPAVYCTAQTNSLGCTPAIAANGMPSYSDPVPFTIDADGIVNEKNGLLFYGYGAQATPFAGGTMCVSAPRKRTPAQSSGGSLVGNDCTGAFTYDMNARIQSGADPTLVPGEEIFAQYWSRDPQAAGTTTNLTDAVQFTICP